MKSALASRWTLGRTPSSPAPTPPSAASPRAWAWRPPSLAPSSAWCAAQLAAQDAAAFKRPCIMRCCSQLLDCAGLDADPLRRNPCMHANCDAGCILHSESAKHERSTFCSKLFRADKRGSMLSHNQSMHCLFRPRRTRRAWARAPTRPRSPATWASTSAASARSMAPPQGGRAASAGWTSPRCATQPGGAPNQAAALGSSPACITCHRMLCSQGTRNVHLRMMLALVLA